MAFHLAGLPGARRSWGDQFPGYLTERSRHAAAAGGVRAAEVYRGWCSRPRRASTARGPAPVEGDRPAATLSPYGVTKLAAERLCLAYANRPAAATPAWSRLRYFTVYGPRQRPDMAFSRIMRAALSGRAVPLYGAGAQRRDFTYVSDAVAATIAAAACDARAEVVNVASGRSVPLSRPCGGSRRSRALRCRHCGGLPSRRRRRDRRRPFQGRDLLGYQPRVDLADGLRSQWEWLTAQEHPGQPAAC